MGSLPREILLVSQRTIPTCHFQSRFVSIAHTPSSTLKICKRQYRSKSFWMGIFVTSCTGTQVSHKKIFQKYRKVISEGVVDILVVCFYHLMALFAANFELRVIVGTLSYVPFATLQPLASSYAPTL